MTQPVPNKGCRDYEVNRLHRLFGFECFNSPMSPRMHKTLELTWLRNFMHALQINLRIFGHIRELKKIRMCLLRRLHVFLANQNIYFFKIEKSKGLLFAADRCKTVQ